MSKLTSKPKLYLNVFAPVTVVFLLNNIYLMTLETPGYLIINLIFFGIVMTFSILSLRSLEEEVARVELVPAPVVSRKNNKSRAAPREKFFRQGALRNAYK